MAQSCNAGDLETAGWMIGRLQETVKGTSLRF